MTTPKPLPTKEDFNPWGPENLDAEHAWQCFGNLTLDEAHARFCECPELYHEDFMFMGGKAYAFYFPVIERFLYEVTEVADVPDDREAWILACGVQRQLRVDTAPALLPLADRIIALAQFVQSNIGRFGDDSEEWSEIEDEWRKVEEQMREAVSKAGE